MARHGLAQGPWEGQGIGTLSFHRGRCVLEPSRFHGSGASPAPAFEAGQQVRQILALAKGVEDLRVRNAGDLPRKRDLAPEDVQDFGVPFGSPLGVPFGPPFLAVHAKPRHVIGAGTLARSKGASHPLENPDRVLRNGRFVERGVDLLRRPARERAALGGGPVRPVLKQVDGDPRPAPRGAARGVTVPGPPPIPPGTPTPRRARACPGERPW